MSGENLKIVDEEANTLTVTEVRELKRIAAAWRFSRWVVYCLIGLGGLVVIGRDSWNAAIDLFANHPRGVP